MRKQDAWARFWQGGALTSFGSRFPKGYEGDVRKMWFDFFESLPANAIVVDLGAGNGALEEIAYDFAVTRNAPLTVHAFDLAPSLPKSFKGRGDSDQCSIVWHTSTPNEATGLPDSSVDGVTSSYAFEYGDDEATVREILRILKPGGRARFLMHYGGSKIISGARNELDVLEAQLEKGGFLDTVRDYLREFGDIRKPPQFEKLKKSRKAEPYRLRMNEAHQRAVKRVETEHAADLVKQVMRWTGELVTPPMFFEPRQVLLKRLKEVREELQANRSRLMDMQKAAVDEARLDRIRGFFSKGGMQLEATLYEVPDAPAPVGWRVDVHH